MNVGNSCYMWSSLAQEQDLQRLKDIVVSKLETIEEEVDQLLFVIIKNCLDENEAQPYFDLLKKMQEILATLFFNHQIEVSKRLEKFISDCDRLDDSWLRRTIYNRVKQGLYNYDVVSRA